MLLTSTAVTDSNRVPYVLDSDLVDREISGVRTTLDVLYFHCRLQPGFGY